MPPYSARFASYAFKTHQKSLTGPYLPNYAKKFHTHLQREVAHSQFSCHHILHLHLLLLVL